MNSKNESFSEILVRYGNKYQIDQSMQSNSLFGAVNAVEVARPAIPDAEPLSDLEKLNKEKELIGIYLSAHPLDKYRIALQYGCNTA